MKRLLSRSLTRRGARPCRAPLATGPCSVLGLVCAHALRGGCRVPVRPARFRLLPSFDLSGLLREAEVLQKLSHPSIIALRDLFQTDDTLYIVTEYVTGGELFDRLVDIGPYTEPDAKKLTWRLFEAIKYMHDRNIVHRGTCACCRTLVLWCCGVA